MSIHKFKNALLHSLIKQDIGKAGYNKTEDTNENIKAEYIF
jgi:hypothetical protein